MSALDSFLTAKRLSKSKKGGKKKSSKASGGKDDKSLKKTAKSPLATLSGDIGGEWADSDSEKEKSEEKVTMLTGSVGNLKLKNSNKVPREESSIKNTAKPEKQKRTWKSAEEISREAAARAALKKKKKEEATKAAPVTEAPSRYVYKPGSSRFAPRSMMDTSGSNALNKLDSNEYFPTLGESMQAQRSGPVKVMSKRKKNIDRAKVQRKIEPVETPSTEDVVDIPQDKEPERNLQLYVPPETSARSAMLEKCLELKNLRKERQINLRATLSQ